MKKFLVLFAVVTLTVACTKSNNVVDSSTNEKVVYYTSSSAAAAADAKNAKYQIIDQEFDNMLAPDSDYDSVSDYELQACGASYLPPAEKLLKPRVTQVAATTKTQKVSVAKTAAKTEVTKNKKVTNTTNIYYVDSATPNVPAKTTSTTTTYDSNGTVVSTTTK